MYYAEHLLRFSWAQFPQPTHDYTYRVACWVTWIIETWRSMPDLKLNTVSTLMKGLGYDPSPLSQKAVCVHAQITVKLTLAESQPVVG